MEKLVKVMLRHSMKISGIKQLLWHANQLNLFRFFEYSKAVQFLELAKSDLREAQSLQLLDVGTGPSILPSFLASYYNVSVICGDIYATTLTYQRLSFQKVELDNFIGISLDAQALPFRDSSFDRVVSISVIEHVQNDTAAITEMVRVLKPDGILVLSFPFSYKPREARGMLDMGWYYIFHKKRKSFFQRYYHPLEFIRLVHQIGANVETYALFDGLIMKLSRIIPPGLFLYKDYLFYKLYERFGLVSAVPTSNVAEGIMIIKVRKTTIGTHVS